MKVAWWDHSNFLVASSNRISYHHSKNRTMFKINSHLINNSHSRAPNNSLHHTTRAKIIILINNFVCPSSLLPRAQQVNGLHKHAVGAELTEKLEEQIILAVHRSTTIRKQTQNCLCCWEINADCNKSWSIWSRIRSSLRMRESLRSRLATIGNCEDSMWKSATLG